jgi:hypothetical protein
MSRHLETAVKKSLSLLSKNIIVRGCAAARSPAHPSAILRRKLKEEITMENRNDILSAISPDPITPPTLESLSKQQIIAFYEAKLDASEARLETNQEAWEKAAKKTTKKVVKKALEKAAKKSKSGKKSKGKKKKKKSKPGRWDRTIEKTLPEAFKCARVMIENERRRQSERR